MFMVVVLGACVAEPSGPRATSSAPVSASASAVATWQVPEVAREELLQGGRIVGFGTTWGLMTYLPGRDRWERALRCQGQCTVIPDATWSLDGSRLAFSAVCAGACGTAGDPYHGIHVVDLASGTDLLVVAGDDVTELALSPDGSRLAYIERDRLLVTDLDGSAPVALTDGMLQAGSPSWSADGRHLAYTLPGDGYIHVVDPQRPRPTALVEGSRPSWSPDGTKIAFARDCAVWTASVDGTDVTRVVGSDRLGTRWCRQRGWWWRARIGPVWSPDGSSLAVKGPNHIYVISVDGSRVQVLSGRQGLRNILGITWEPRA